MKLVSYLIILIAFLSCTLESQSEYDLIINDISLIDGTGDSMMLGISDEYGTIEEGKIADMILLNHNPVNNISNTLSIEKVIKDGEVQERMNYPEADPRRSP